MQGLVFSLRRRKEIAVGILRRTGARKCVKRFSYGLFGYQLCASDKRLDRSLYITILIQCVRCDDLSTYLAAFYSNCNQSKKVF